MSRVELLDENDHVVNRGQPDNINTFDLRDDHRERIDSEYYNKSEYFDEHPHLTNPESRFQRYRIREVLRLATPEADERVVDLGCGWGTIAFALGGCGAEVVGIDFSQRAVDFCQARKKALLAEGCAGAAAVEFLCADGGETTLRCGTFDLVVAADLFEHLYPEDTVRVAAEAYRLLKPGGRFAVWTPHRRHVLEVLRNHDVILKRAPSHVDYKSMERTCRYLSDAGFEVERNYYAPSHLPGLRTIERCLQPLVPWLRRRIAVVGVRRS